MISGSPTVLLRKNKKRKWFILLNKLKEFWNEKSLKIMIIIICSPVNQNSRWCISSIERNKSVFKNIFNRKLKHLFSRIFSYRLARLSSYKIVFLRRFVNSQDCMLQKVSQFLRLSFKIVFFNRLIYSQDCMLQKVSQMLKFFQDCLLQQINLFTRLHATEGKSDVKIPSRLPSSTE